MSATARGTWSESLSFVPESSSLSPGAGVAPSGCEQEICKSKWDRLNGFRVTYPHWYQCLWIRADRSRHRANRWLSHLGKTLPGGVIVADRAGLGREVCTGHENGRVSDDAQVRAAMSFSFRAILSASRTLWSPLWITRPEGGKQSFLRVPKDRNRLCRGIRELSRGRPCTSGR